jgi:hypothetical protein
VFDESFSNVYELSQTATFFILPPSNDPFANNDTTTPIVVTAAITAAILKHKGTRRTIQSLVVQVR